MKKTLLIGAALLTGVAAFAQSNLKVGPNNPKKLNTGQHKNDVNSFPVSGGKRLSGPVPQPSGTACLGKHISSAPNALDVTAFTYAYTQSMLTYKPGLNVISYTHRRSEDWAFAGKNSGAIQTTWLNLTTGFWDSSIVYMDSTLIAPGRAPQGIIYNPTGNTSIANAYAVTSGVASPFTGTFYNARKLTGTAADQALPPNAQSNHHWPGAPFGNGVWINQDMAQVGAKVIATGPLLGKKKNGVWYDPNLDYGFSQGGVIIKADFTGANPVWSIDSISPGLKLDTLTTGYASDQNGARVAFAPDNMTGYAVILGRLATTYSLSCDSMLSPLVYKTTNGGTSWVFQTAISQGYDWNNAHPELTKNTTSVVTGAHNFTPNYTHGIDVTVDALGTLHFVCVMNVPYNDGVNTDSLMFGYSKNWDYVNYHPIMWDLMTNGSCWKTMMIDSLLASEVSGSAADTVSYAANPWGDGSGGKLGYGARLQVSRSTDGTKIIYGWADCDPLTTASKYNIAPEIMMKGYDVTTGMLTANKNVTNGISQCYFLNLSDVSYFDNTSSKWITPAAYTVDRVIASGIYDGGSPADHYLVNCSGFGAADFNVAPTINNDKIITTCAVDIKTNSNFTNAVNNYPNPFNHSTNIVVTLTENKVIAVNVYDAIGNLVYTKNVNGNFGDNTIVFNAGNLNAGVYYYTVAAGTDRVTKKMVIQK